MVPVKDHIESAIRLMYRGARMRLDAIPDDPTFLSSSFGPDVTAEIAKILSAAISEQTLPVRVKALKWRSYGNQHRTGWQGIGRMGYLHYISDTGPDGEGNAGWFSILGRFDTAEAAKAAAQQDFETRIRAALVDNSHASEAVVTEGMVEAGLNACSLSYFRKAGDQWSRCSVDSDDVRRIVSAALSSLRPAEVGSATNTSGTGGGE